MGSRGKILFDLNELPTEEECHNSSLSTSQFHNPQPPTSSIALDLLIPGRSNPDLTLLDGSAPNLSTSNTGSNQGLLNNHAFKHAPAGSLFQPFIRNKDDGNKGAEREEGEWSDIDGNAEVVGSNNAGNEERESDKGDSSSTAEASKDGSVHGGDAVVKREVKGVEASYALKFANNAMKRSRIDEQKEEKLGKRRPRQTMFINVEDAKQAGPMKGSTPKRQTSFPTPIITRSIKEKQTLKQSDATSIEGTEVAGEPNGDPNGDLQNASRSGSWKQFVEPKQPPKGSSGSSASVPSKKMGPTSTDLKPSNVRKHFSSSTSKKQLISGMQYQDTSVERLIREVTSEKFWHNPGTF
jgi:senataxin